MQRNICFGCGWRWLAIERPTTLAVAGLSATLVLEPEAPDFSTDAGNSALIVDNEISASPAALFFGLPGGEEKNNNEISKLTTIGSPGRERHVTE